MARCQLIHGRGEDLIWDVVLCCDNRECAYCGDYERAEMA